MPCESMFKGTGRKKVKCPGLSPNSSHRAIRQIMDRCRRARIDQHSWHEYDHVAGSKL